LASTLSGDTELDTKSASISVVGKDRAFEIIEGSALQVYLDAIEVGGSGAMVEEELLENPEL
jgi:hypothetical protein